MKKKGFTLIELLAVIVILAIIALIAVPVVTKVVQESKENSFKDSVYGVIKSLELNDATALLNEDEGKNVYVFPTNELKIKGEKPSAGYIMKNSKGQVAVSLWSKSVNKCAVKSYGEEKVTYSTTKTKLEDCSSMSFQNPDSNQISISLPGQVDDKISNKSTIKGGVMSVDRSCYTFDKSTGKISNYDVANCGSILVIPNKLDDTYVKGFSDGFLMENEITDFYAVGVEKITYFTNGFLMNNKLKTITINNLPELIEISNSSFSSINGTLEKLNLTNLPKLNAIINGSFSILQDNVPNKINEIIIKDLPNLTTFGDATFARLTNLNLIELKNLPKLSTIKSSFSVSSSGAGIRNTIKLENFSSLSDSSSFHNLILLPEYGYVNNLIIKNMPKLKSLTTSTIAGFNIKNLDLSGLEIESIQQGAINSANIGKIILPATLKTIEKSGISGNISEIEVLGDNPTRFNEILLQSGISASALPK